MVEFLAARRCVGAGDFRRRAGIGVRRCRRVRPPAHRGHRVCRFSLFYGPHRPRRSELDRSAEKLAYGRVRIDRRAELSRRRRRRDAALHAVRRSAQYRRNRRACSRRDGRRPSRRGRAAGDRTRGVCRTFAAGGSRRPIAAKGWRSFARFPWFGTRSEARAPARWRNERLADSTFYAHESSYVDEPSSIGQGTKIWHFTHVMAGCEIGRDCTIGQNFVI